MAMSSSTGTDLSSLLQINQANQRISFSVRVRNVALPSSCDNMGLPWIHVDVLPSCPLTETLDYRYRPYSVPLSPVWRHRTNLWLDRTFDSPSSSHDDLDCSSSSSAASVDIVDSMEDIYFPVDIPAIACIELIGCLYCVISITAGHAPVASAAIVNSQADEDVCGEDDHLHKRVSHFAAWEPLWTIRVADVAKFESLSASSDNKFTKTTIVPSLTAEGASKPSAAKPINMLRFQMSSARRFDSQVISPCYMQESSMAPPVAKKGRLKLRNNNTNHGGGTPPGNNNTDNNTNNGNNGNSIANTAVKVAPTKPSKAPCKRSHNNNNNSNNNNHCQVQTVQPSTSEQPVDHHPQLIMTDIVSYSPNASLDLLPPEIIFQIVNAIPGGSYEQLKTLTVMSSINRRLRKVLSDSSLYTTVDLKPVAGISRRLSPAFFTFLANRCDSLRSLRLSWIPSLTKGIKLDKIATSGCLTTVIAQSCPLVDDDFLKTLCRCNPNVETLDLSSCWSISRRGFGCLDSLKNLRRLSLAQTLICQKTLDMLLIKFDKLETLNLSNCHDISSMDGVCSTLSQHSTKLISLDLSESPSLSPKGIAKLAQGCHRLQELVLFQNIMTSNAALQAAPQAWRELRRLVVHLTDITSLELLAVEKDNLPLLEQLSVSSFRRGGVPIAVLFHLLAAFPQLSYLKVPIEWPSAADFEESRAELANLRRTYPKCVIQTQ